MGTPLERLESAYAEAMEAPDGVRFFRLLSDYLYLLDRGPIKRAVKRLTKEVDAAAKEYQEQDADLTRRLVAIRDELVALAPDADDSDTPHPGQYNPLEDDASGWHAWRWTLANFDAVASGRDDAIKAEKEGDRSPSRIAGEILNAKIHNLVYPDNPNQKVRDDLDELDARLQQARNDQAARQRHLEHVAERTGFLARKKLEEIASFLAPRQSRKVADRGSEDELEWVNELFKETLGGFIHLRELMRPKEFRGDLDARAREEIERLMTDSKEALERAHRPLRRRLEEKRFTSWNELRPGDKVTALVGVAGIIASITVAIV